MAIRLNDYEFSATGRPATYPWAEWSDGSVWQATRGIDFGSATDSFINGLYAWARRNNKRAQVRKIAADQVVFQIVDRAAGDDTIDNDER